MFECTRLLGPIRATEKKLQELRRWSICQPFLHASDVYSHTERVELMLASLAPLAVKYFPGYDPEKAARIAIVHDHPERYIGDEQACLKALMTKEQKQELAKKEMAAIRRLVKNFPARFIGKYQYKDLLWCAYHKNCIESQLMKLCDKWDAFCEALHEVLAGNNLPLPMLIQDIIFLICFADKYPLVRPLLESEEAKTHPLLSLVALKEFPITEALGGKCSPHTVASISRETNYPAYDHWKRLIIFHLGQRGMDYLTVQKEHFTQGEILLGQLRA